MSVLNFFFNILLHLFSEVLEAILLKGLLYKPRNSMKFFGQLRMNCFRSLSENFRNIGRIETSLKYSSFQNFVLLQLVSKILLELSHY